MRNFSVWLAILTFTIAFAPNSFARSRRGGSVCVRVKEAKALTAKPEGKRDSSSVTFAKYSPFRWTGKRERGYSEVRSSDGKTFWIRNRDLSSKLKCLSVVVNRSQMYSGPGKNFEKLDLAERGDAFLDLGGEDGWTQVQDSEGHRFWINLDHTWKPSSVLRMSFIPEEK